jgi:hypothetical protein
MHAARSRDELDKLRHKLADPMREHKHLVNVRSEWRLPIGRSAEPGFETALHTRCCNWLHER